MQDVQLGVLVPQLNLEVLLLLGEGEDVGLHLLLELDQGIISTPGVFRLRTLNIITSRGAHHHHCLLKLCDLLHQVLVHTAEVLEFQGHCMQLLLRPLDLLLSAEAVVLEVEGVLFS